ncbi:hypothetical protein [Siphonobacter sp. SORGH_AS_1065]|uniref:hypothetical protein n=1 Tax=Siphonobacter sp. SORGH_AS_1065 TaxID=3041795 RepID=UPI002780BEA3|nr:hypothetical protein [Siphonobacter sp. SORGH_AS_1065]MDQ1090445.1 hypothetical protein [Siphonobacter sp. SORGH_AS_1065]
MVSSLCTHSNALEEVSSFESLLPKKSNLQINSEVENEALRYLLEIAPVLISTLREVASNPDFDRTRVKSVVNSINLQTQILLLNSDFGEASLSVLVA